MPLCEYAFLLDWHGDFEMFKDQGHTIILRRAREKKHDSGWKVSGSLSCNKLLFSLYDIFRKKACGRCLVMVVQDRV